MEVRLALLQKYLKFNTCLVHFVRLTAIIYLFIYLFTTPHMHRCRLRRCKVTLTSEITVQRYVRNDSSTFPIVWPAIVETCIYKFMYRLNRPVKPCFIFVFVDMPNVFRRNQLTLSEMDKKFPASNIYMMIIIITMIMRAFAQVIKNCETVQNYCLSFLIIFIHRNSRGHIKIQ